MAQKSRRLRSPAYPAIGLQTAIDRARDVWNQEKREPAPVDVIVDHWGYKPNSANGQRCLAALRQYGLLDEIGDRGERQVKLSELALSILLDEVEDSPERATAIKRAALNPKIHGEIWIKKRDASTANLRTYLVRDREFNPSTVDAFISKFRETISFANVTESDILSDDENDNGEQEDSAKNDDNGGQRQKKGLLGMVRNLDIPLQNGGTATFPVPMTSADHALLTTILTGLSPIHVQELPATSSTEESAESADE